MKRGTPDHHKTEALAEAIAERWPMPMPLAMSTACGLLERLWHWTSRYAPTGAFGDTPMRRVIPKIGWPGEVDDAVKVLLNTHWLDQVEGVGLVVHDWQDHADDTTRKALEAAGLNFWDGTAPRRARGERIATTGKPPREPSPPAGEPLAKDSRITREAVASEFPPPRQGSGSGKAQEVFTETAPTVASGTVPPTTGDEDLDALVNAAWCAFPHWRGDTRKLVLAWVWKQVKDGLPPARKLNEAVDALAPGVSLARLAKGLRKYLAEKRELYGLEDFVAHLNDYAPPERKPTRSIAETIPDTKPERTPEDIAAVKNTLAVLPWRRQETA